MVQHPGSGLAALPGGFVGHLLSILRRLAARADGGRHENVAMIPAILARLNVYDCGAVGMDRINRSRNGPLAIAKCPVAVHHAQ
ncbi:MAG TPA: hypothetical protein VG892_07675 [Terriglobales bacterium]|nr:hypothetical protein [Terriglobales bacterium]